MASVERSENGRDVIGPKLKMLKSMTHPYDNIINKDK